MRPQVILASLLLAASPALSHPPERTLPVDPIELIAGHKTDGKPEHATIYEGIEYRFISEDNKAAFEKDPKKYRVADGGACGRMGPLSGIGDARRYAVHDNRIYFFSSDACRAGFLKDPAIHIESDDEKVFGSNDQVLAGRAVLDKCLVWAGGADRLRALTSYRDFAERVEVVSGQEYKVTNETVMAFPSSYYQREAWGPSWFSTSSSKDGGSTANKKRKARIADGIERGFIRRMARLPVVILKAHADGGGTGGGGGPAADCPGLIVTADGEGELNGAPVEHVKVWLNGAASRLTIDKATGKLLQLSFRGRDGSMSIGDSVRTFTAYATVEGITLPTAYTVTFNAKDLPAAAAKIDTFEVNPKPAPDLFTAPAW
jgi:YHS domain-containing protein